MLSGLIIPSEKYSPTLPNSGLYTNLLSLIISQEVAFNKGRLIRRKIYAECGIPIDPHKLLKCNLDEFGLTISRSNLIRTITKDYIEKDVIDLEEISLMKGIGPWTIKGTKLLSGLADAYTSLYEDSYIRKRIKEYLGLTILPTIAQTKKMFEELGPNQRSVTIFLWRIKPSGIKKLLEVKELNTIDFV